ncbi:metallophosphoesterase family protein [Flavihumibacter sp. UBA7668]|uniref:metallophosphoesterase family protein n=1 Tax=Flavihumibacter sp. UBA7668 TaxID=1946542 RepID=UPI0025BB2054|nr:metallophosphoesterase [Flavihumibacter sp. UBA7668]
MQRRKFLRDLSCSAFLLMANGAIKPIQAAGLLPSQTPERFRFAITSDGHYGQPNTPFDEYYRQICSAINTFNQQAPLKFTVANGDLIHDNPNFLEASAKALKPISTPLYVTKGNHDRVTDARWKEIWNQDVNHAVELGDNVLLLGTTSNEKGTYLSPDTAWFETQLKKYSSAKNIFLFFHITPIKWTEHAVDATNFQQLLKQHKNIRAAFNGHDHQEDGVKMFGSIPFLFDGHFGGSWGVGYRGFRVVEILPDNSLLTYMMSPIEKMAELTIFNSL